MSKVADFSLPDLHLVPHRGWSRSNFAKIFALEW